MPGGGVRPGPAETGSDLVSVDDGAAAEHEAGDEDAGADESDEAGEEPCPGPGLS